MNAQPLKLAATLVWVAGYLLRQSYTGENRDEAVKDALRQLVDTVLGTKPAASAVVDPAAPDRADVS